MKVGIDIRRLTEFGVGTYLRNVVRTLGRLDEENQYVLIGSPEKSREFTSVFPNFTSAALPFADNTLKGHFELRSIVRQTGCDVVHIPHLSWAPLALPCPYVMTVHDVLSQMSRESPRSAPRRKVNFRLTSRALHKSARILAVSQFTKSELESLFKIPPSRIEVIYNAIDERFLSGHASKAECESIAERYQVNTPFLLYAGAISPHKNLVRIIEAFSVLKAELKKDAKFDDLKLIIIGDDLSSHQDLRRAVVRGDVQNDVRFLGFVPIDVLRIFYDAAKVFVFPSLHEGFGLPPLEAMAHGTPVVTSNSSSLPEVTGNAAVLVNPENVFDIMRALQRTLLDRPLREKLKQRGYAQVQRFSWPSSVGRILEVYREVAGQSGRARRGRAAPV